MAERNDPVLDPIKDVRAVVDKRRSDQKWVAQNLEDAMQAVKDERAALTESYMQEIRKLQDTLVAKENEATEVRRDLKAFQNAMALRETKDGHTATINLPRRRDLYPTEWTIDLVEEALFRLRVAGARDKTPVTLGSGSVRADVTLPLPPSSKEQREIDLDKAWDRKMEIGMIAATVVFGPPALAAVAFGLMNLYGWVIGWFV